MVADFARRVKARVGVPVIATGRILDPADADRLVGEGVRDAVGMTRAMIADPNLARKARSGEPVTRCIACNQGCIGHYHAVPDRMHGQSFDRLRGDAPRSARRVETREELVVIGAGPASCARRRRRQPAAIG